MCSIIANSRDFFRKIQKYDLSMQQQKALTLYILKL